MNKTSFYGQDLWIQYAPEYETVEDVRSKLEGRRIAVLQRLEELAVERPDDEIHNPTPQSSILRKLFTPTNELTEQAEPRPAGDWVPAVQPALEEVARPSEGQNKQ